MDPKKRKKIADRLLGTLELFIGANAVAGGWLLIADPSGGGLDLQLKWLNNSPFDSYLLPGLVLFGLIGIGNLLASVASFFHKKNLKNYSFILGIFLVLFLTVEVRFLGLVNVMQLVIFILGGFQMFMGIVGYDLLKADHDIYVKSVAGYREPMA